MTVIRKPCLMEDEGRSFYIGEFTEEEFERYLEENTYFSRGDYIVY